jgi:hypothetical protein
VLPAEFSPNVSSRCAWRTLETIGYWPQPEAADATSGELHASCNISDLEDSERTDKGDVVGPRLFLLSGAIFHSLRHFGQRCGTMRHWHLLLSM